MQTLTIVSPLIQQQRDYSVWGKIRARLLYEQKTESDMPTRYTLDSKGVLWQKSGDEEQLMAVPNMMAGLLAVAHTFNGHKGMDRTLALVKSRVHWPTLTNDTTGSMLSLLNAGDEKKPSADE